MLTGAFLSKGAKEELPKAYCYLVGTFETKASVDGE